MLRTYGPSCDGSLIEAKAEKIPDTATWVDLEEPTKEEEALVERCIHMDVPTESEMAEIEPSSRLYEQGGALYMTDQQAKERLAQQAPAASLPALGLTGIP